MCEFRRTVGFARTEERARVASNAVAFEGVAEEGHKGRGVPLVEGRACAARVTEVKRGGPRGACAGQRAVGPGPSGPLARRLFLGRIICRPWRVLVSALGKVSALKRRRRPGGGDFLRITGGARKPGRLNQRHWCMTLKTHTIMERSFGFPGRTGATVRQSHSVNNIACDEWFIPGELYLPCGVGRGRPGREAGSRSRVAKPGREEWRWKGRALCAWAGRGLGGDGPGTGRGRTGTGRMTAGGGRQGRPNDGRRG